MYGDKRDYKPIEIYIKRPGGLLEYVATTTWARDRKEARERYAFANNLAASDLYACYKSK
jgi:hypothetical protein